MTDLLLRVLGFVIGVVLFVIGAVACRPMLTAVGAGVLLLVFVGNGRTE